MIREVVSETILRELRDPRIRNVTVLGAEVSSDLRYAKVHVSVRGDEKLASLTMHGLNSARGYLQSKVADYIRTRYTPELRFVLDSGIDKSFETARILRELNLEEQADGDSTAAADATARADTDSTDTDAVESSPSDRSAATDSAPPQSSQ
jgi:ribosome-binding factor A